MTDYFPSPVTVLGLGPMGRALASALLDAGHPTTVWNRTAGKADELVARGARPATTPADAIAAGDLIVVCVLDYDAAEQILSPAAGQLAGRTVVQLTADSPDRARRLAAWTAGHGATYLDGAIMTPAFTIGGPDAVVLYSGPRTAYDDHLPTLTAFGGTATHLGEDPGRAAAHDVALLDLFWTSMTGLMHAFALAGTEGIRATELAGFARGIAELLPPLIDGFAEQIDRDEHPGTVSDLTSAAAAIGHIVHASEQHGLDARVLRAALDLTRQAITDGHGGDDYSRLTSTLLRSAGVARPAGR